MTKIFTINYKGRLMVFGRLLMAAFKVSALAFFTAVWVYSVYLAGEWKVRFIVYEYNSSIVVVETIFLILTTCSAVLSMKAAFDKAKVTLEESGHKGR